MRHPCVAPTDLSIVATQMMNALSPLEDYERVKIPVGSDLITNISYKRIISSHQYENYMQFHFCIAVINSTTPTTTATATRTITTWAPTTTTTFGKSPLNFLSHLLGAKLI